MADLNKFQRSKDRIAEVLNYLMSKEIDLKTNLIINTLQKSIQIIDDKIDQFNVKILIINN